MSTPFARPENQNPVKYCPVCYALLAEIRKLRGAVEDSRLLAEKLRSQVERVREMFDDIRELL